VLASAVLAGCGSGRPPIGDGPPDTTLTPPPAQAALDALVAAARRGDRAAFDARLSDRDPVFASRARLLYTNLATLPLDRVELRLQPGAELLTGARRDLLGAGAWRQPAVVTWRLRGEAAAAERTVWLTFLPRDGIPLLAGTIDRPSTPIEPQPIWWTGPVTAHQDGSRSVLAGAGQRPEVWGERLRSAAARVQERVTAGAAASWGGDVVLEVPASRRDFAAVLGVDDPSYAGIAAVTVAEGPAATGALRIVVNPEMARTLTPAGVAVVVLHETVHVATRSPASPAPTWLVEGLADYVALQAHPEVADGAAEPLLRSVRASGPPDALPVDERFHTGAEGLAVSYAEAWLACRYIAEKHSPAALQRLYTATDAGTSLADAVPAELGDTVPALTAGWQGYLVRLAAG